MYQRQHESKIYFTGQTVLTNPTSGIAQGFRIGAKVGEKLICRQRWQHISSDQWLCQMAQ